MSTGKPQDPNEPIVEHVDELARWIAAGEKPKTAWRLGTEHEKFVYDRATLKPVGYDGPTGIRALLEALSEKSGWPLIIEGGVPIGLKGPGASVSLEPGGQFELSGAPLETVHETCNEANEHLSLVKDVAKSLGISFFGMGFAPTWRRDEMPKMPKARYDIMRAYMPKRGSLGLDMMHRTCTVQVNLDFSSEADMAKKFRVSLAAQPIATALFANSNLVEGAPSGWASWRGRIWMDTDPDRTGLLDFVFEDGFGYERYVDYMLDVPMYFARRDGRYVDMSGQSFRAFLKGEAPGLPGERARLSDWEDHLSTAFPEVRLKRFLEMRGADAGPWAKICALPAFWVGLLYDEAALDAAWDIVKHWSADERRALREDAARDGFRAKVGGRTVKDVALDLLAVSRAGLTARGRMNWQNQDETVFLNTLQEIAEGGVTAGELKARRFAALNGDLGKFLAEMSY